MQESRGPIAAWLRHENVLASFTATLQSQACRRSPLQVNGTMHLSEADGTAAYNDCLGLAKMGIRSVKLAHTYSSIEKLLSAMEREVDIELPRDWRADLEGHSLMFAEKARILQDYADDDRVDVICEIGFNAGHSVLNWVHANPKAQVVTFDITRRLYTSAAVNAINRSLFPDRNVLLITGDSLLSVPNFSRFDAHKNSCNILYIDGGHSYQVASADILNMKALANQTFHRVIIDDSEIPDVSRAWTDAQTRGVIRSLSSSVTKKTTCLDIKMMMTGPLAGAYDFLECMGQASGETGSVDITSGIAIGEYIL